MPPDCADWCRRSRAGLTRVGIGRRLRPIPTLLGQGTGAPSPAAMTGSIQQVPTSESVLVHPSSRVGRGTSSRAGGSRQVAGQNPNGSSKFTPKDCTPRRLTLVELSEISNPLMGIGGRSFTLVQTRLKQQIHRALTLSFLLLAHLPDFSANTFSYLSSLRDLQANSHNIVVIILAAYA